MATIDMSTYEVLNTAFQRLKTYPTAVSVADPTQDDTPLIYINQAFSEMTGYAAHEVEGRNCRFLQGENTDREAVARLRESIANGTESTTCLLNYRKDGTSFHNVLIMARLERIGHGQLLLGCQYKFDLNAMNKGVQGHCQRVQDAFEMLNGDRVPHTNLYLESMKLRQESILALIRSYEVKQWSRQFG